MWYKVKELKSKGLNCVQIAHELGLHRQTVMKYDKMTLDEFQAIQTNECDFKHKLDIFEEEERISYRLENRKKIFNPESNASGKQSSKATSKNIQTQV